MPRSCPRRRLPIDLPEAMLPEAMLPEAMLPAVSLLALGVALAALVRLTFLLHP